MGNVSSSIPSHKAGGEGVRETPASGRGSCGWNFPQSGRRNIKESSGLREESRLHYQNIFRAPSQKLGTPSISSPAKRVRIKEGDALPFIPSHFVGGEIKDRISRTAGGEDYRGISHFVEGESREMESRKQEGKV